MNPNKQATCSMPVLLFLENRSEKISAMKKTIMILKKYSVFSLFVLTIGVISTLAIVYSANSIVSWILLDEKPSPLYKNDYDELEVLSTYRPQFKLYRYIRDTIPPSKKFLLFRQNEFAYYLPEYVFIRHFDPRISDFYLIENEDEAFQFLKKKRINYVVTPRYNTVTYANSMFSSVVSNPEYSRLVKSDLGYKLYELLEEQRKVTYHVLLNFDSKTQNGEELCFHTKSSGDIEIEPQGIHLKNTMGKPLYAYTGNENMNFASDCELLQKLTLRGDEVYRLTSTVSGNGAFVIFLFVYDQSGVLLEKKKVWNSILSNESKPVSVQFIAPEGSDTSRLLYSLPHTGVLRIHSIKLSQVIYQSE